MGLAGGGRLGEGSDVISWGSGWDSTMWFPSLICWKNPLFTFLWKLGVFSAFRLTGRSWHTSWTRWSTTAKPPGIIYVQSWNMMAAPQTSRESEFSSLFTCVMCLAQLFDRLLCWRWCLVSCTVSDLLEVYSALLFKEFQVFAPVIQVSNACNQTSQHWPECKRTAHWILWLLEWPFVLFASAGWLFCHHWGIRLLFFPSFGN